MQLCTPRVIRGNSYIGGLCRGPIIRGTRYGTSGGGGGTQRGRADRARGTFCVLRPLLTHVQLHNSIVVSIRAPFSPGLSASSLRRRAARWVGEVRFNELSQTRFWRRTRGKGDFDVKRAPWNKHSRACIRARVYVCVPANLLVLHVACARFIREFAHIRCVKSIS